MADPEQAIAAQLRNIETRTARDLISLCSELLASGFTRHGELRSYAVETFGLGYGDANSLAHFTLKTKGAVDSSAQAEDALAQIYSLKKAHLRAIHDKLVNAISAWGPYELAPKMDYVAFRRQKQFAMLGPRTSARSEMGINLRDDISSARILKQKPGGMCQYAVALTRPDDLDEEILTILRRAFDAAIKAR